MADTTRGTGHGDRIGTRMRVWGWWTRWRVARMAELDHCRHDGTARMCWACVLVRSHIH